MPLNYDEAILRGQRVQPSAPFAVAHQAVRIAMYNEYAARSFYTRVIEAFGPRAPFDRIVRSEVQHIAALGQACDRLGCARPLDPFPAETRVAPTWRANCERAVAGEIDNINLYDALLPYAGDTALRATFLSLQAASRDRHLPAFLQALGSAQALERYHASHGIAPEQAQAKHGVVSDLLERVFAQLGPGAGLFGPMLRNIHPAMLTGFVVGGAGAWLFKQKSRSSTTGFEDDKEV